MATKGLISTCVRNRPRILLFGDSITEFGFGQNGDIGWASLLSSSYSRRADILSRGFSGYNTRHALSVLESAVGSTIQEAAPNHSNHTPLLFVTIFFGANDASLPTARQHLPLDEYCDNLRKIISKMRRNQENEVPIILFTPPPVSPKAWDHFCTVTSPRPLSPRSNDQCKLYGSKVIGMGKELNCPVVDTYQLLGGDKGDDYYGKYLVDGIHLTGDGNVLVYDGLMDVIKKDLPHLAPMIDGDGRYGKNGVPLEEKLWSELC